MLLLIDNYDSFTYNLFQYLAELGADVEVVRNDKTSIKELSQLNPDHVVISPGPSNPDNAGISVEVAKYFSGKVPLLGVCLGHQCIATAFGGVVANAGEIRHGKTSLIHHDKKGIFADIENPFEAIRYHSLSVQKKHFPEEFEISAWTDNGIIMGIRHRTLPVEGVQFHPESILTRPGKKILENFLTIRPDRGVSR